MAVANDARLRNRLRYMVFTPERCGSGDRNDRNGGADGDGGEGESGNDREGGALGEFEADEHDGGPFCRRSEPFAADVRVFAASVPVSLSN
jgi:hypothetical protein